MTDDDLAGIAEAAKGGAIAPGPTGEPALVPKKRDWKAYQPAKFRGNPVAKGIDWAADMALGKLTGLPPQNRPGTGDLGAAWAAFLFYIAGVPAGGAGALHPGINAAIHSGKYGYEAYDAIQVMQEAQVQEFKVVHD